MRRTLKRKTLLLLICAFIMTWVVLSISMGPNRIITELTRHYSRVQSNSEMKNTAERDINLESVKYLREGATSERVLSRIRLIAKLIHKAKQHVRGSKTSGYLHQATEIMNSLLKEINIEPNTLRNRTILKPKHVCPEKYMGTTYGYPFFYKGFETTSCGYGVAVSELVTIIKLVKSDESSPPIAIQQFLSSVYETNNNFSVVISTNLPNMFDHLKELHPTLKVVDTQGYSEGTSLNMMVRRVNTPYVFVARTTEFFTEDSRLERLVREIESLQVKVAGGSMRETNGHWTKGCFQSAYRNFTLRYLEGYDESVHECLFCDYVLGPFIATKEYLEQNKFQDLGETEGLFEDWFLGVSNKGDECVVCPDSMFNIQLKSTNDYSWKQFMDKWNLFKIVTPSGYTITQNCDGHQISYYNTKTLSPCSLQFNADAVKTIMGVCDEAGIICELQEGTALGAVKLGKILPWERDADLTFLTANYSAFQKLESVFEGKGFRFSDLGATWCCADTRTAGGKFKMNYKGWSIELYGQHIMDSELLIEKDMQPTQILLDGQRVNVPRNPGLFMRNRYGREIYQHAQHWITTGDASGWINYNTNVFMKCAEQGEHDCLDRYNADGDLQFIELLP